MKKFFSILTGSTKKAANFCSAPAIDEDKLALS